MHPLPPADPTRDLVLTRDIPLLPPEALFAGWTTPELLVQWFTPAPWRTVAAEVEPWPGGRFHTVMRSPEGDEFPGTGCVLEVVPGRRFAWTSALAPGFRPIAADAASAGDGSTDSESAGADSTGTDSAPFVFSAVVEFAPHDGGTRYTATVRHADAAARAAHEAMGFHTGWGAALDQLVALLAREGHAAAVESTVSAGA